MRRQTGVDARLPLSEWQLYESNRAMNRAALGSVTVSPEMNTYADLVDAVTSAEQYLVLARNAGSSLAAYDAGGGGSATGYREQMEAAAFAYDRYLHWKQIAITVKSQFLRDQWFLTGGDHQLLARVDALPIRVDGINAQLTQDQYDRFRQAYRENDDAIQEHLDDLDYAVGGLQAAQMGVRIGFFTMAALTIPGLVPLIAAVGTGVMISSGVKSLQLRQQQQEEMLGISNLEVAAAVVGDLTAATNLWVGFTNRDPLTGQTLNLSPEEMGAQFGMGATALSLMVATLPVGQNPFSGPGASAPRAVIPLSSPGTWPRASSGGMGGLLLAGAGGNGGSGGVAPLAFEQTLSMLFSLNPAARATQIVTTVGGQQVIVILSAPPTGGGKEPYDKDDYKDENDPLNPQEIAHNKTAEKVGEQAGKEYVKTQKRLHETDYVNPLEHPDGTSKGIDDVMIDDDGNVWLVEYKGGRSTLEGDQMETSWVLRKLQEMQLKWSPDGPPYTVVDPSVEMIVRAGRQGKLKGIAVHTEYGISPGPTNEIGKWSYLSDDFALIASYLGIP